MKPDESYSPEARAFIEKVRLAQRESGSFRGSPQLHEEHKLIIHATATHFARAASAKAPEVDVAEKLLGSFEKLCRKQGMDVPDGLRPEILAIVVEEFETNQAALRALGVPPRHPERLVPATVLNGAVVPALVEEFPAIRRRPHVFRDAVLGHVTDPRAYVGRIQQKTEDQEAQPGFKTLMEHFQDSFEGRRQMKEKRRQEKSSGEQQK